ncbi:MAG: alpha/beta fold hydrolase [Terriglobales bacterium]|jgi:pimeloyl-ACP methyl ester carboxylesterase
MTIIVNLTPRQTNIPIEDLRMNLDGLSCRYQRAGSGPALLLVHGLLGYSFSWRYTIPALAHQATVYALDLPGTGFSDRSADMDCGQAASAKRLLGFMDQAGIASCDLLGTSHGGALAMMAATLAPQRVRRLILVAPANPWSAYARFLIPFLSNPAVAPVFLQVFPRLRILQDFYFRRLFGDTRRIRPGTLEGYAAPLKTPGSFEYGLSVLRTWKRDMRELQAAIPRIAHIPTLLIWGDRDPAVEPASAYPLKAQFQNCRLIMLEGVGHLPYEEVPEEFNRTVAMFLS